MTTQGPLEQISISGFTIQLQGLASSVQKSIDDLVPITNSESTELQSNYTAQLTQIQAAIAGANSSNPTALRTQLQKFQTQIGIYNSVRDKILVSYVGGASNFLSAVKTEFKYYCTMTILVLGPLFGFIVMTNAFYAEKPMYKFFYGFWGALWYPLTILFAIIDPPKWRALVMPLTESRAPFFFFEFWKYHVVTDIATEIEDSAKSKTMMRLISLALATMFFYCFFM
jgi:hypothetical protein